MNETEGKEIKELNFDQFHPLDHSLWSSRCGEFYGAQWQHGKLWWEYKFEYKPSDLWHKVLCKVGRHDVRGGETLVVFGREVKVARCCVWCYRFLADEAFLVMRRFVKRR